MRNGTRLLTLSLVSAVAILVAPRSRAVEIELITNFTCTDVIGTGTTCSQSAGLSPGTDLLSIDNDRFQLDVSAVVGTWYATVSVDDGMNSAAETISPITSPGTYYLLFSDFLGLDVSAVDAVVLEVSNASSAGDFITVDRLAAVPEPSTGLLLATGLVALAASRRRLA